MLLHHRRVSSGFCTLASVRGFSGIASSAQAGFSAAPAAGCRSSAPERRLPLIAGGPGLLTKAIEAETASLEIAKAVADYLRRPRMSRSCASRHPNLLGPEHAAPASSRRPTPRLGRLPGRRGRDGGVLGPGGRRPFQVFNERHARAARIQLARSASPERADFRRHALYAQPL